MKKSFYIYGTIILSMLFACKDQKPGTTEVAENNSGADVISFTDVQIKNAKVTVGKAEMESIPFTLPVSGVTDVPPQNAISVSFPLGGYLKNTKLIPGMHVTKGEVIAVVQDPSFIQLQQDFLTGKSKLEYLEQEMQRQTVLNTTKASSDKIFQQTKSEFDMQRITTSAQKEKLKLLNIDTEHLTEKNILSTVNILSPINGYVTDVKVNIGKYVNPSDVLFELVDPTDLHLALTVFEKDLPYLTIGQKIKAVAVAKNADTMNAEVILVSKKINDDRSSIVHCHFVGKTDHLLPGMFMNALLEFNKSNAYTLPENAIVRSGENEYAFAEVGKNEFRKIKIIAGARQNGLVEITNTDIDFANTNFIRTNAYSALMKLENKGE
jgi:cobalt-zinc-cadmium efflux system membrane fusion protein